MQHDKGYDIIMLAIKMLNCRIEIFTRLNLCLPTANHNFKWVKHNLYQNIDMSI